LAFLLHADDTVAGIDADGADIVTASGARQRYYRKPRQRLDGLSASGGVGHGRTVEPISVSRSLVRKLSAGSSGASCDRKKYLAPILKLEK
jgi:hypothetical protein